MVSIVVFVCCCEVFCCLVRCLLVVVVDFVLRYFVYFVCCYLYTTYWCVWFSSFCVLFAGYFCLWVEVVALVSGLVDFGINVCGIVLRWSLLTLT